MKKLIFESRVPATEFLCQTLTKAADKPKVILSASGVGYYGDKGDDAVTEDGEAGKTFLAHVCSQWEKATNIARQAGIRVVNMRIGVVLGRQGGALEKMLPPFKLGIGGRLGNGRQYMSWIALDDLVRSMAFCLSHASVSGPVNLVSPQAVRNSEFTRILASVLRRPALFPLPVPAAKLLFGQMAEETLLASTRAEPRILLNHGFRFQSEDLRSCLIRLLGSVRK